MGKRAAKFAFIDKEPCYNLDIDKIWQAIYDYLMKHGWTKLNEEFAEMKLRHLNEEMKYLQDTEDPTILEFIGREYHLPDDLIKSFFAKVKNTITFYEDGFNSAMSRDLSDKVRKFCNEKIFVKPITFDEWNLLLKGNDIIDESRPIPVKDIADIAMLFDAMSRNELICQNWQAVAEQSKTFASSTGKPITAIGYKTALHRVRTVNKDKHHTGMSNAIERLFS